MAQLFANAARSTLTASITSSSTQLQINPADQALFPVATGADWFKVALEDSSGNLEYMRVQRAVGQSLLTITERATEDATKFPARSFVAGSLVELRMTAADLAASIAHPSVGTGAHAATAISVTPAGGISAATVQAALQELDTEKANAADVATALDGKASTGANTFTGAQTLPGEATQDLEAMPRRQLRSAIGSSFRNLKASATGANALVAVSADEIVARNISGDPALLTGVSLSIDSAASGANGLDTGTVASNTWYAIWVIWNGTTAAGLLSLSGTAPTLPSGYTHRARVGWTRTASSNPMAFSQFGRRVCWVNTGSGLPSMAGGAPPVGSVTTPTWVAVSTAAFVPPTASSITTLVSSTGGAGGQSMVAPSNSYGAFSSTSNPPLMVYTTSTAAQNLTFLADLLLESSSIFWAHTGNFFLAAYGWEDNL